MRIASIVFVWALALSSCRNSVTCDAALVPAIQLTARDGQTGAFIGSQTTVIAVRHGAAPDTIVNPANNADSNPIWIGAAPGAYDLTVKKIGYADWVQNDIIVQSAGDACPHPVTTQLTASLQRVQ
jgi:hypothetical protein